MLSVFTLKVAPAVVPWVPASAEGGAARATAPSSRTQRPGLVGADAASKAVRVERMCAAIAASDSASRADNSAASMYSCGKTQHSTAQHIAACEAAVEGIWDWVPYVVTTSTSMLAL
jgi:hypothetical protein